MQRRIKYITAAHLTMVFGSDFKLNFKSIVWLMVTIGYRQ